MNDETNKKPNEIGIQLPMETPLMEPKEVPVKKPDSTPLNYPSEVPVVPNEQPIIRPKAC